MPGSGKLRLTGQLGSVMKESAHAALSWIRSHASQVPSELLSRHGVCLAANDVTCGCWWVVSLVLHRVRWLTRTSTFIFQLGPFPRTYVFPRCVYYVSGGDLMSLKPNHCPLCLRVFACALCSQGPSAGIAITTALVSSLTQRCARCDTAMTGEVTLRGSVLPVGGIKEKLLGAHRGGIRRVILSSRNERDVEDVPKEVRDDLTIFYVSKVCYDMPFRGECSPSPSVDWCDAVLTPPCVQVDDVFDLVLEEAPTELRSLSAHHEAATKADNEVFARVTGGSSAGGSGAGAGADACAGTGGHVARGDSDQRVAVTGACLDDVATNPLLSFL